jgi:radical SAM superfamily enzyme with C-terminal helix-hairpin-helix motif
MAWCSELGILAELEIILGMPTETENNFQENYSYLKRMMKVYNYCDKEQRDLKQVTEDTLERIRKTKKLLDGKLMQEVVKYIQHGILTMADLQGIQRI